MLMEKNKYQLTLTIRLLMFRKFIKKTLQTETVSFLFDPETLLDAIEKQNQSKKIDCPDCNGSGKYQGIGKPEICKTCNGYGRIEKKKCSKENKCKSCEYLDELDES